MQNEIDKNDPLKKNTKKIYSRYVILLGNWSYCGDCGTIRVVLLQQLPKTREEFEEDLRKGKELQRRMEKYSLPVDSFQCEIA